MRCKTRYLATLLVFLLTSLAMADNTDFGDQPSGEALVSGVVVTRARSADREFAPGRLPVQDALVEIEGTQHRTKTNINGQFSFMDGPQGEAVLVIKKEGYATKRLQVNLKPSVLPTGLTIELVKAGATGGPEPTGPGTLYAAFAPHSEAQRDNSGGLLNLLKVIAINPDYRGIARATGEDDPNNPEWSPLHTSPSFVLIRPPEDPGASSFHNLTDPPLWTCFDSSGRYLYVATVGRKIQVFDISEGREMEKNLPVYDKGFATSLERSPDGKLIAATVMSARIPGVMMIDTKEHLPVAYLTIDNSNHMIPTALDFLPDSSRLLVTLSDGLNDNANGRLVAIDPYTGETLADQEVGRVPTDVKVSKDGAYAFVVNSGSGTLEVIELEGFTSVLKTPLGVEPLKVALATEGRLLVTNRQSGTVSVLQQDGQLLGKPIRVGAAPLDIVVSDDGNTAYVSNSGDGTLSVLRVKEQRVVYTTTPMPRANPYGLTLRP